MNTRAAIDETMRLAAFCASRSVDRWTFYHESLSFGHLTDMHSRIDDTFDEAKLSRWLGWMQAAIVSWGAGASVEQMKEINRKHS